MPPKQKFTKKQVITAALNITRREGITGVTARSLGAELGVSSRPIFTAFKNMEEVQNEIILAARALYNEYTEKGLAEEIAFKGVGMQYFRFAKNEPKLFELLFMTSENARTLADILPVIDDNSERILSSIQEKYGVLREPAYRMYQNMWVFTHGLACLCATGVSRLTEEEADERLTEMFIGLLIKYKKRGEQE